ALSKNPRYALVASDPNDAWFFNTMKKTSDFNINVDPDVKLKLTKIWFNVIVKDGKQNIGLAGTGLDLTKFLDRFVSGSEAGVTPMILNKDGAIQAHPNRKLIDYSSVNDKGAAHSTIFRLLSEPADHARMKAAMEKARKNSEQIQVLWAETGGRRQLFALSFIPELDWYTLTAVDVHGAQVIDNRLWLQPLGVGAALLVLLVLTIIFAVDRILLTPLLKLTDSARSMAAGNYSAELPAVGNDELGQLTQAFGAMATQVRAHTEELETRVQERTSELVQLNQKMSAANTKIGDSIRYASLIQNAILPDRELQETLSDSYFVLWRPRDVVGGDFYVFRAAQNGYLIGVVDCAGHGVPGALMTMIAHSAINVALDTLGLNDPAAVLNQVDARIHALLQSDEKSAQLATHMDAGLAFVNFETKSVTFAGAKTSLYWCDGHEVGELKGDRYAIGGKRRPVYSNKTTSLDASATYYLTTDGLLDQAGGTKGYSFGTSRFANLLKRHAVRPFDEQKEVFAAELAEYQGSLAQRDDITL
ncbi:MAG TPA: biofilm regulation protein phosphatase SiaA, partial [Abditibacteriaceae bacterium]